MNDNREKPVILLKVIMVVVLVFACKKRETRMIVDTGLKKIFQGCQGDAVS